MKKLLVAISLMAVLMVGTSFGKNGMLLSDFGNTNQEVPCSEQPGGKGWIPTDGGIIVTFTGIIVTLFEDDTTETNCGILLSD
jgi:hypothetical protein